MATRSRTTFQKRQKELARMEKRQEKFARRLQRKQAERESPEAPDTPPENDLGPAGAPPQPTE
jgi:hypothetical protein